VALFTAVGLAALAGPKAAAREPTPWVVAEIQGDATQQAVDGAGLPLAAGAVLAEGASVTTGTDGRLVVVHGNDRMTVSPNSAFAIPRAADPATGPSILQTLGTLLFKVEHTPGRRFEVETPYLAAVVKGTVFTVGVDSATQVVHVAQGAVEVTALGSHEAALVRPGQTATLSLPTGVLSVIGSRHSSVVPGSGHGNASQLRAAAASNQPGGMARLAASPPSDGAAPHITRTLGDAPIDISAVTHGLVKAGKHAPGRTVARSPDSAAGGGDSGVSVILGSPTEAPSAAPTAPTVTPAAAMTAPGVTPAVSANPAPVVVNVPVVSPPPPPKPKKAPPPPKPPKP
jgi:hypothetical protein